MQEKEILELVEKYLSGTATSEEESKLMEWYRSYDHTEIQVHLESEQEFNEIKQRIAKNLHTHIHKKKQTAFSRKKVLSLFTAAAAVLIIVVGIWYLSADKTKKDGAQKNFAKNKDIEAPKDTRAVITFGNGSKVYLDSANNGTIAQENNVNVVKNENGQIIYNANGEQRIANSPTYNTLFNPRGSKVISLTLSDGTKVWLNSESTLIYPIAFNSNTREVQIIGEAYFEVVHNAGKPFHVKKGNTDVLVLGTHFNVNAYDDEDALRVTLLEGSVNVSNKAGSIKIKPGEQAEITHNSQPIIRNNVDLDAVMAWKYGLFQMNNSDVGSIMRQISRWYDVDVVYENGIPDGHITGKVPRNINLSNVLKVMEYSGIKFSIEEKRIVVKP